MVIVIVVSVKCDFLPPANEVWGKVIFFHLFVILFTGGGGCVHSCWGVCMVARGACMVAWGCVWLQGGSVWLLGGVHAWLQRGACVVAGGDMHGCWGVCVVVGDMHGCQGVCVVAGEHVVVGGHAWLWAGVRRILRGTVNERSVRILLECILVDLKFT